MRRHDPARVEPGQTLVIAPDAGMVRELEPLLKQQLPDSPASLLNYYPAPPDLSSELGPMLAPLVLLDVSTDQEQALAILSELTANWSGCRVLALLKGDDPNFILRCLRAGAADFLLQPFTNDQLDAVLSKLARMQPAVDPAANTNKVITVMPAKGACGATTVACNLAFCWKRMGVKKVLLADLDLLTGTLSFLLKIKSVHSFMDVLQRSYELDEDLWRGMITTVDGVDVLLAPELVMDAPDDLNPMPILEYARQAYDIVVLDAGSVYGEWNLAQAKIASDVLLITTNELPALQAAQRALSYLESNRIGRWKTRLVVNRYHRDVGLSREVIGTALHTEVFDSLPSDYDSVQKALMEGKAVPSGSVYGKSLMQLAERLTGPLQKPSDAPSKKSGGLSGLFGLFSRQPKQSSS